MHERVDACAGGGDRRGVVQIPGTPIDIEACEWSVAGACKFENAWTYTLLVQPLGDVVAKKAGCASEQDPFHAAFGFRCGYCSADS